MSRAALVFVRNAMLAMLAIVGSVSESLAGCDFAQDASRLVSLNFGKIELSGFRAGDLSVTTGRALADGDEWNFTLDPKNRRLRIAIAAKFTPGLRVAGTLHLARPIAGYVSERITNGKCKRTLHIAAESLKEAGLEVSQGVLNTRLGTVTGDLAGQVLSVRAQSEVIDGPDDTSGTLGLSLPSVTLPGASIMLARLTSATSQH